ncbi:MAG: aspartate aminotransferase family protein [Clostridia bacterium]
MKVKTTEGDVNQSKFRADFQKNNLSSEVLQDLACDDKYFINQALSTPCLNTAQGVDGIYIIDGNGRKIIDWHGNSVHQLGYNHPKLVKAMQNQLKTLSFSPRRYANDTATACAKKLCELMPNEDFKVLFTTSGAVSNETALKLVRKATGKHKVLSAHDSFHGATLYTISVGGTSHFRDGLEPLVDGCVHFPHYASYNSVDPDGKIALEFIENECKKGDVGAIIIEPVRCTDVQIPPKSYFVSLREICDTYDVALIFDEIPTAFGRTGTMYSFENFGVTPDILTLGKGLGGSLIPFSAVVAHKKFDVCGDTSMGHFTHEKNPLGSAVALALIKEIEDSELLNRACELGEYIKSRVLNINTNLVADIRQIGALVGVELMKNGEKAEVEAEFILYNCLENGLSFKISQGNVLTLSPALISTDEQMKNAMNILENAFNTLGL